MNDPLAYDDSKEPTLSHFRDRETSTFYDLAEELGVAPVEIERRLRREAERCGCFDYFVRSALLRQLYHYVPTGIRRHGDWKLNRALSSWVGMVGRTAELERFCRNTADAIQHDCTVADDWLPSSADDPDFVRYFEDAERSAT
jgi:hypothetical protein